MRNVLVQTAQLVGGKADPIKKGAIFAKNKAGGWYVTTTTGGTQTVHGEGSVGDEVIFRSGQIISRIEEESIITFYIT